MVWAITEITNSTTKIIASHLAIVNETPEISPNPSMPATMATIKKTNAQYNQLVTPRLFIAITFRNVHPLLHVK